MRGLHPLLPILLLMGALLGACGQHRRDNPLDPGRENRDQEGTGIELIAALPQTAIQREYLVEFRYEVSEVNAQGNKVILSSGEMNLVGESARAQVAGVPRGSDRIFRVDAFDGVHIRTFSAEQIVEVGEGYPQVLLFELQRLKGDLELTAELPPEVDSLEVVIAADGDSLRHYFGAAQAERVRIDSIPTGADVRLVLRARDQDGQVLLQRQAVVNIRDDLLARLSLTMEVGALQVVAYFPEYLSIVAVDRFSDQAGYLYRRSESPELPGPGEPIDFDQPLFFFRGFGPDGEQVEFYNFDVQSNSPGPVYLLVDRRGDPLVGQLPIFDLLPGEEGYSDLWQIHHVHVKERDFKANQLTSLQAVQEGGYEITATGEVMNGVMVPRGSKAERRFDAITPTVVQDGWYRGQVVSYLLFESPESSTPIVLAGERIDPAEMYVFLENDRNFLDGFARDQAGRTHNVATRLPGTEADYAPLWLLRVLELDAFEQVTNSINASQQIPENLHPLDELQLRINAPIVGVR